jgi:hypothetical protein
VDVIGYQTIIDIVALRERTGSTDFEAKVQPPVSEAASTRGTVVIAGSLANPAVIHTA